MKPVRYLVLSNDNSLHGYDREDILRCDLATNNDQPPKKIFRLSETSLTIRYEPIDVSEILSLNIPPLSVSPKPLRSIQASI